MAPMGSGRRMTDSTTITPNDGVAFLVEVASLALLGIWGWRRGHTTAVRWLLALVIPLAAAILWALFAAPRSRFDVPALEIATKVLVLGAAVVAAHAILPPPWWWAFATVVMVNFVLLYVGPWAR